MEKQLQSILDKLYQEGVQKGKKAADELVRKAEEDAKKIRKEAEQKAEEIRSRAEKDAEERKKNVQAELKLAAGQSVSTLKQQISELVVLKVASSPAKDAFSDPEFIKKLIAVLVENWNPGQTGQHDLTVLVPASMQEPLRQYLTSQTRLALDEELHLRPDEKLENGFRIGPSDGSYRISFTDKDFEAFFMDYLRPATREMLFGKSS